MYILGIDHRKNCLLDVPGSYYDKAEYEAHVNSPPGEIYSPDEQCRLAWGDSSSVCTVMYWWRISGRS